MWREKERGQPVDSAGQLITGESFNNIRELKHILATDRHLDFYRTLTEKLLIYALGRGLEYYDAETVDRIVDRLEKSDGHFSALLMGVIESTPFQKRRESAMFSSNEPSTVSPGRAATGNNQQAGWLIFPGRPLHEMSDSELDATKLDSVFYLPLHVKELFSELKTTGADKVGGRMVYVVTGRREHQPSVRLYLDQESGLLLRVLRYDETPVGRNPVQTDLSDYRDVSGVKVPFQRVTARPARRMTIKIEQVEPNVKIDDSKFEKPAAAATAPYAVFDNAGQDCCARSRILVQRSVYDQFLEQLEPAVQGVRVGDPALPATQMGPLISAAHRERVAAYVPDGAPVVIRGRAPDGPGFWYPPTVLAAAGADSPAFTDEVFGPVVTVTPFEDEAQAIAIANDTPYGLSGSIWTGSVGRAIRVARGVESGNLSVNSHSSVRYWTPFGGFKQSGLGRELGPDALASFTDIKNVFISTEE